MQKVDVILQILGSALMVVILAILIINIAYLIACLIISSFHKPTKFWATLPVQDWGVFFLLKICRDKYRKKCDLIMNQRAEEKMFNYILESRLFPKRDSNKAQELLEIREITAKYFKAEHFNAADYRQLIYEYETEGVEIQRLQSILPFPLSNPKTASLFAILIKNNILDENCLPLEETTKKKGFYYTLADVIWDFSGLKGKHSREEPFAKLWAGKSLWEKTSPKNFENNMKQGINDSYDRNMRESIEKMLSYCE